MQTYQMYCMRHEIPEDQQAMKTCFTETVKEMIADQEIKLLGSKGA